jgi:hypothetical protein
VDAVLRLYILGPISKVDAPCTLTIFGEYKTLRGLSRIDLTAADVEEVLGSIAGLRSFVEGGYPELTSETLVRIGARLFDILITHRTRDLFLTATGENKGQGHLLPLEIVAEDPALASWPWEYMYNTSDESFIAQEFHPISRSIFSMTSRQPLAVKQGGVRILMILGVLPDDPYTTPAEEIRVIRDVFQARLGLENVVLDILPASEYKTIPTRISNERIDIVHYFGHAQFDYEQRQGYLSICRPNASPFKMYAKDLAILLLASGVRLVFLNACKTAEASSLENPGRSSLAGTLLNKGIPAVIGTQFSLPDVSAHILSATIYDALLLGKPVGQAVRSGRNAMFLADDANFFDWGIPVLYSTDPSQVLFQARGVVEGSPFINAGRDHVVTNVIDEEMADAQSSIFEGAPQFTDTEMVKVALVDIDSKVGFLPDAVTLLNDSQSYYQFEVAYRTIPSGYVRSDIGSVPQTFVPRLDDVLRPLPKELGVDYVCGLTQHPIAGNINDEIYYNYFTSSITQTLDVFVISTYDLRRYAREADVPFSKAVLYLCLSMLLACDLRWGLDYHQKTHGCFLDLCEQRADIIVGLKKGRFDHIACRKKIKESTQLEAIDAFWSLDFSESHL